VLEQPLEVLHVSTPGAQGSSHHLRVLLRLAKGSRATLIERYVGLEDAKNLTNSVLQAELAESSSLQHIRVQTESAQGFHVGRVLVKQKARSEYRSHNLQLGGQWVRLDLHTRLEEEGAHAVLNGLYAVNGRQHADNHTRIDHLAPGTLSEELYRGILDGQGRAVFNGKVVVAKHAVRTDARQANHNLLLSRGAEIDTKPELQIDADDVKCSHGASVGQLDEQQLFYLRSRGLDAETARDLLIAAFAERLIAALPHPALAEHARRKLSASIARAALPELP
jgi:Fe-S cluster assembly protein SufD